MPAIPGPRTPTQVVRALRSFQNSLPEGLEHLQRNYGAVSAFGVGPTRTYFLYGPQANALVMRNADNFRFAGAYDMLRPIAGDTALVVTDGELHDRRKRKAQPSFHRGGAEESTRLILDSIDERISGWRVGQRVDIYHELRESIRSAMIRTFCGEVLAAQQTHLTTQLDHVHALMDYPLPQQLVAWSLPSRARNRALNAIAEVGNCIYAEIARRRRGGEAGEDLISVMMSVSPESGSVMSDQEIRDMVMSALIAGYDPVSSGLGWAVYNVLANPGVWEKVRAESLDVLGDAKATSADVRKLRYVGQVINESLRLNPPVVMSPRRCVKAFRYGDYTIPAGSLVAVSEYITHRLPEVWDDPERFMPERWDRDREGHRVPSPFEYLPYGYGPRRCIGAGIATAVLPAALSRLTQRTSLELLTLSPQLGGIPAMIPRGGLFVRVGAAPLADPVGNASAVGPR